MFGEIKADIIALSNGHRTNYLTMFLALENISSRSTKRTSVASDQGNVIFFACDYLSSMFFSEAFARLARMVCNIWTKCVCIYMSICQVYNKIKCFVEKSRDSIMSSIVHARHLQVSLHKVRTVHAMHTFPNHRIRINDRFEELLHFLPRPRRRPHTLVPPPMF